MIFLFIQIFTNEARLAKKLREIIIVAPECTILLYRLISSDLEQNTKVSDNVFRVEASGNLIKKELLGLRKILILGSDLKYLIE